MAEQIDLFGLMSGGGEGGNALTTTAAAEPPAVQEPPTAVVKVVVEHTQAQVVPATPEPAAPAPANHAPVPAEPAIADTLRERWRGRIKPDPENLHPTVQRRRELADLVELLEAAKSAYVVDPCADNAKVVKGYLDAFNRMVEKIEANKSGLDLVQDVLGAVVNPLMRKVGEALVEELQTLRQQITALDSVHAAEHDRNLKDAADRLGGKIQNAYQNARRELALLLDAEPDKAANSARDMARQAGAVH